MASISTQQSTAEGAPSRYRARHRHGLGPRIDPTYDAEVGRLLASMSEGQTHSGLARGYIELLRRSGPGGEIIWTPYQQLIAIFAVVYRVPHLVLRHVGALRIADAPLVWTQITRLRYLTSDGATGVALPLYSFNPDTGRRFQAVRSMWKLLRQLRRLRRLTGGKLERARTIGLTIDFDFTVGAERLRAVIHPAGLRVTGQAVASERPPGIDEVLFGRTRRPFRRLTAGPGIDTQDLAASGGLSAQLKNAIRELRHGDRYPTTPVPSLDFGISETGSGVIVGVVDFGCDFAHPSFCDPADRKRSRLLALWDQNDRPETDLGPALVEPEPPYASIGGDRCAFGFGRVFTREKIDRVLHAWRETHAGDRGWPYGALGYDPHDHYYTRREPDGAHGTIVLDIAAGGRRPTCPSRPPDIPTVTGVAPRSDIVFVQARTHRQPDGRRTLDANDVVDAVAYIFHLADQQGRPCVVNLSLNTMSGPHDGDGHLERRLADLLRSGNAGRDIRGRSIVIAAGNLPFWEHAARRWQHISDVVSVGEPFELFWNMTAALAKDVTRNSLEIWYDAAGAWLEVTLEHPASGVVATVGPGHAAEIIHDGKVIGSVIGSRVRPAIRDNSGVEDGLLEDPGGLPASDRVAGRHVIFISLDPHLAGQVRWKIRLRLLGSGASAGGAAGSPVRFDAWLERDDEGQTGIARTDASDASWISAEDRASTIGTLSCGEDALVVAAYNAANRAVEPSEHSARGPGRNGQPAKPDLSAPGEWIWLARSKSDSTCVSSSGTSLAAPFVTGTIACLYEIEPRASLAQIKDVLFSTARKDIVLNPTGAWSERLGRGRLNPQAAVSELRRRVACAEMPASE
ncbi:MAG: S8 family serine peptidase [Hyphomicrobiaceae bacterium]|nr:S8 family serine peptidase [Hyphomicrobiaceae bacterium]